MKFYNFLFLLFLSFGYSQFDISELYSYQNSQNQENTLNSTSSTQNLPYPIIFIHGLNSNSDTWIDLATAMTYHGLTFGGRIDFCLNYDGNNSTANKLIFPGQGADIALFTDINTLNVADIYFLNFDIDNFGRLRSNINFSDVLSNESAIVKQGVAVKLAIQIVLQKTGRDKVILMGHSMGGLASREYIQNPINWQADGQHHVAKLITTGTPHGGYTGTNAVGTTIDSRSEAYRDLRKEYTYSGYDGVYLYGGIENTQVINNSILTNFYNVDVNCNGINSDNSNIVGLNQKNLPLNLDYAYIIGNCQNCFHLQGTIEGDGIVRSVNANLNNFYTLPTPRNEFIYTANASTILGLHSDLPSAIPVSFQGLDEPNEYHLSYQIEVNKTYKGFISNQPVSGYSLDYDDYKFSINTAGQYTINVVNTYSSNLNYRILDNSLNILFTNAINPNSNASFQHNLIAGNYYLEFYSSPNSTSYIYPYSFNVQQSLSIDNISMNDIIVYPNPFSNQISMESKDNINEIFIYNYLGQLIKSFKNSNFNSIPIDLSDLENGSYVAKIHLSKSTKIVKLIKN